MAGTWFLNSESISSAGGVVNDDFDAKGDLIVGTADGAQAPLTVGSNGKVLRAASGETTGLDYAPVAGYGLFQLPPTSGWTSLNLRTGGPDDTITAATVGRSLKIEAVAGVAFRGEYRSAPTAPYHVICRAYLSPINGEACFFFRQSSDGKLIIYTFATLPLTNTQNGQKYTNETTFSANYYTSNYQPRTDVWWCLQDDGSTNRKVGWSLDRENWTTIHTIGRTDFLTADEVGWAMYPNNSGGIGDGLMTLLDWEEVSGTVLS